MFTLGHWDVNAYIIAQWSIFYVVMDRKRHTRGLISPEVKSLLNLLNVFDFTKFPTQLGIFASLSLYVTKKAWDKTKTRLEKNKSNIVDLIDNRQHNSIQKVGVFIAKSTKPIESPKWWSDDLQSQTELRLYICHHKDDIKCLHLKCFGGPEPCIDYYTEYMKDIHFELVDLNTAPTTNQGTEYGDIRKGIAKNARIALISQLVLGDALVADSPSVEYKEYIRNVKEALKKEMDGTNTIHTIQPFTKAQFDAFPQLNHHLKQQIEENKEFYEKVLFEDLIQPQLYHIKLHIVKTGTDRFIKYTFCQNP